MTRLAERFARLKQSDERALICYVMAGDPTPSRTRDVVLALEEAGADAVELGIPFSDPLADGPSIQAAGQRALAQGVNVARVLDIVAEVRRHSQVPIILMTYFNPILRYGPAPFARDAAAAGADATIQVDLTPDEADDWLAASREASLDTVFLVAPTSTGERIALVARVSTGFVYAVSRTGVTGARQDVPPELPDLVKRIRRAATVPVCVGFGISQPEHVRNIAAFADGVVVGSALVDAVARAGDSPDLSAAVRDRVRPLKDATRSAG